MLSGWFRDTHDPSNSLASHLLGLLDFTDLFAMILSDSYESWLVIHCCWKSTSSISSCLLPPTPAILHPDSPTPYWCCQNLLSVSLPSLTSSVLPYQRRARGLSLSSLSALPPSPFAVQDWFNPTFCFLCIFEPIDENRARHTDGMTGFTLHWWTWISREVHNA